MGDEFDPVDGVSAVDDVYGDITKYVVTDGVIDTTKAGIHTITYTAVDRVGNKTKHRQIQKILRILNLKYRIINRIQVT